MRDGSPRKKPSKGIWGLLSSRMVHSEPPSTTRLLMQERLKCEPSRVMKTLGGQNGSPDEPSGAI